MRGPLPTRIGWKQVQFISGKICHLGMYLPKEFCRKGRALAEVDRWKATEFRTFLLYTAPVALKGHISETMYQHFLLFHVAITILCSPTLSSIHCDYAEQLLMVFVQNLTSIYGDFTVYNVHSLIHLADDVRKFGPLPNFSAFPFETYLHQLKQKIRKPAKPLAQIVRRLTERETMKVKTKTKKLGCTDETFENLLLQADTPWMQHSPIQQYKKYTNNNFTVCLKNDYRDNAVLISNVPAIVQHIVVANGITYFVCFKFLSKASFFTYPLNSLELDISVVKNLDEKNPVILTADKVKTKVVLMPYLGGYVAYPLNHTL